MIITLCGSTRFQPDIEVVARKLTAFGHSVFKPEVISTAKGTKMEEKQKSLLAMVHAQKILKSDEVYVVSRDHYIGPSTAAEIEFSRHNNITTRYVEDDFPYLLPKEIDQ